MRDLADSSLAEGQRSPHNGEVTDAQGTKGPRLSAVRRGWDLNVPWWASRLLAVVVGATLPLAAAAVMVGVRTQVPNASVALGLAVVVCAEAAVTTRVAATVAALVASLSFDVLFTRPYGSVTIASAQDLETTGLLLVIVLVVGQVAARNRQHRLRAAEASYNLGRVHAVAEMVAAGAAAGQVVLAVQNELTELLRLRSCRFDPSFSATPGPFIERNGSVSWGALRWGFTTLGLPAKEVSLIVEHQGLPLGRFVLVAPPGMRVTEDELVTAVALSDQAGAAIAAQGVPSA